MTDPASTFFTLPPAAQRLAAQHAEAAPDRARPTRNDSVRYDGERGIAARQIAARTGVSVEQAIANAARATSVDFSYLVAQARVESAMDPRARAATSSATGLYQFIESTWLDTMKRHGARFGMGELAARIATTPGGSAYVADPAMRESILELRNDPQVAALMAAGLAEDNRAALMPVLGRQPEPGELYLAHFLGAGGAGRFLSAMQANPSQSAASLFQRPAAANQAVFYEGSGAPRSLAGVMDYLDAKLARAMGDAGPMPPGGNYGGFGYRPDQPGPGSAVPYLITAEEVFGPRNPPQITPQITGPARASSPAPLIPSETMLPLSPPPPPPSAQPAATSPAGARSMSGLFGTSREASGASELASPGAQQRIQRAHDRLRALGL